jgi:membrane-anchored protein YejM (alkaline phosphatase superfamily)
MDTQVGRVMDEMEALDLVSSTIVLIHGDHGWQLGEHNSWHKFTNFELGTRVPLIVRVPWKTASIGKRVNMMVELIDVYPTVNRSRMFGLFAHAVLYTRSHPFCAHALHAVLCTRFLVDRRSGKHPSAQ